MNWKPTERQQKLMDAIARITEEMQKDPEGTRSDLAKIVAEFRLAAVDYVSVDPDDDNSRWHWKAAFLADQLRAQP